MSRRAAPTTPVPGPPRPWRPPLVHEDVAAPPRPRAAIDVGLSDPVPGYTVGWPMWRRLRGGGLWSWLRWCWSASVTDAEARESIHLRLVDEMRCHHHAGFTYCWCDQHRARAAPTTAPRDARP